MKITVKNKDPRPHRLATPITLERLQGLDELKEEAKKTEERRQNGEEKMISWWKKFSLINKF